MKVKAGRGYYYPYNTGEHLILPTVLYGYGDESGLHQAPKYTIVAGYIGPPDAWEAFGPMWEAILATYGVDQGFRAHNFFGGSKEYRAWDGDKRNSMMYSLLSIIASHEIYPFGMAVEVDAFNALSEVQRRYFTGGHIRLDATIRNHPLALSGVQISLDKKMRGLSAPRTTYRVAAQGFLMQAVSLAPDDCECEVHVVLGSHNALQSGLVKLFNQQLKGREARGTAFLQSVTYADTMATPALQAADLNVFLQARLLTGFSLDERMRVALTWLNRKGPGLMVAGSSFFKNSWDEIMAQTNQLEIRHGFPPSGEPHL